MRSVTAHAQRPCIIQSEVFWIPLSPSRSVLSANDGLQILGWMLVVTIPAPPGCESVWSQSGLMHLSGAWRTTTSPTERAAVHRYGLNSAENVYLNTYAVLARFPAQLYYRDFTPSFAVCIPLRRWIMRCGIFLRFECMAFCAVAPPLYLILFDTCEIACIVTHCAYIYTPL